MEKNYRDRIFGKLPTFGKCPICRKAKNLYSKEILYHLGYDYIDMDRIVMGRVSKNIEICEQCNWEDYPNIGNILKDMYEEKVRLNKEEVDKFKKDHDGNKDPMKNIAICCKTSYEASKCCELADKLGHRWWNNESFKNVTCYEDGDINYYDFCSGQIYDYNELIDKGYKVKSAQWFLDNFGTKDN